MRHSLEAACQRGRHGPSRPLLRVCNCPSVVGGSRFWGWDWLLESFQAFQTPTNCFRLLCSYSMSSVVYSNYHTDFLFLFNFFFIQRNWTNPSNLLLQNLPWSSNDRPSLPRSPHQPLIKRPVPHPWLDPELPWDTGLQYRKTPPGCQHFKRLCSGSWFARRRAITYRSWSLIWRENRNREKSESLGQRWLDCPWNRVAGLQGSPHATQAEDT